jgi:formylglycine-generating enzyme
VTEALAGREVLAQVAPADPPPGTGNQYAIYGCYYPNGSGTCTSGATNITPVGTATLGAGLGGQLDLVGEVGQWNLDWYAPYLDPCTDCADLTGGSERVIRGGGWGGYFDATMLYLLPPSRNEVRATYRDVSTGFRCARVP